MKTPLTAIVALSLFAPASHASSEEPSPASPAAAADTLHGLPLKLHETFDDGVGRWEFTDEDSWAMRTADDNNVLGITQRRNNYKPPHRSPYHIALLKEVAVGDFALTFRVRSTLDTGGHRDCCVFFGYQDPAHFYYVHLGARPDPNSGQIMLVQDAPRKAMTDNEKPIPWTDDWHDVKVVRDIDAGTISVYFDDMENPWLTASDKTFGVGRIGIGSFDDKNEFDNIRLYAE